MNKLRLGVIACGARGRDIVRHFLKHDGVSVAAVYDPDIESVRAAGNTWGMPDLPVCGSGAEVIVCKDVNFVMIFSPNCFHKEYIVAALRAGKKVFSEKPLATTLEDCREVLRVQAETKGTLLTGFVLRYTPLYRKVKELLDSGSFGKIINISASENREAYGGGNSMSSSGGWRRLRKMSGPYLLEKCSHDLDLLNWFIGEIPRRVAGFGGLDLFHSGNKDLFDDYGYDVFGKYVPLEKRINPFTSEKDIYDNHAVAMEYPSGAKVNFQLTLANAIPERRMYISCTRGSIIVEAFSNIIRYKRYEDPAVTQIEFSSCGDGHAGGDSVMASEIVGALLNDADNQVSGGQNGLDCAIAALAADLSMKTGKIIDVSDL